MGSQPEQALAVVIGAVGMGTVVARRFAQHYRVQIADIDRARLDALVAQLNDEGMQAEGLVCDVTSATADVIEYIASDRASYINGVDLLVDGGLLAGVTAATI